MSCRRGEQGATLILTLFLLLAMLLMGASAAQLAWQSERAARGERDRQIAFQAAEEALRDAERDIARGAASAGRVFAPDSALGFVDACGAGAGNPNLGLCLSAAEGAPPVWQSVDLAEAAGGTIHGVPYGTFTGAQMQTGAGFLPFRLPRYIIELVPYNPTGAAAGLVPSYLYRVTALGFGARESSQVVLQSFYRKQAPARRMSWREIANWHQLHDAAIKK